MHLAEINIARLTYPLDDPRVADFVDNLDRVNRVAENMPGFVWRLKDDTGNATAMDVSAVFPDPMLIVNMSVWEDAEALERFVWQTVHKRIYQRRQEWFDAMTMEHFAMWWVEEGHEPSLAEAKDRLDDLRTNGASERAFGWEGLPNVSLWKSARCA